MDNNIHTLTAYRLAFNYIRRNNPHKEELSEVIQSGDKPTTSVNEIISLLMEKTTSNDYELLSSNGKVIILNTEPIEHSLCASNKRIRIEPYAGKRDIPTRMVNLTDKDKKVYDFGKDWSSTYKHYVFFYDISGEYYAVFHRKGGSGCKTVFNAAVNQILKQSGIKMEMNWLPPTETDEDAKLCSYEKVTLLYEEGKTSDIADNLNRRTKRVTVKELTLNLRNNRFPEIINLLKRYRLKEIGKTEAFSSLIEETGAFQECNNAKVTVKLGKSRRIIEWDDFENLISGYDITEKIVGTGTEFIPTLTACADEFIMSLIKEV